MSQFYARYVPPQKSLTVAVERASEPPKRKRNDPLTKPLAERNAKKQKVDIEVPNGTEHAKHTTHGTPLERTLPASPNILEKYSSLKTAKKHDQNIEVKSRTKTDGEVKSKSVPSLARSKQKEKEKETEIQNAPDDGPTRNDGTTTVDDPPDDRHSRLLSKYDKSIQIAKKQVTSRTSFRNGGTDTDDEEATPEPMYGLEPIPQPEDIPLEVEKPTYPTVPGWQSAAIEISSDVRRDFTDLGVSQRLLASLQKEGIEQAFPVQAGVLPLLFSKDFVRQSDLCVSASTGSGKTLAYVVPIVESLKQFKDTKLRAVIVVPTRELVKQVQETCNICTSGTSLKILTALGSRSLQDEQEALVEEEEVYNVEEYNQQQNAPTDWSNFSLRGTIIKMQKVDPLRSINYVRRFRSKIDILITTPGRLVDHLKSTTGFNLDSVDWLVVDEADRLLNESYQEWLEVVVPALQTQNATRKRDHLLRQMYLQVPARRVTKILLSATMTRDISKLNSMGLHNPKLVVLGGDVKESMTTTTNGTSDEKDGALNVDESGLFHLPPDLQETAVIIKDGTEKPLQLLELLQKHLQGPQKAITNSVNGTDHTSDTSSSDSDSDDSTDDSDSDDSSISSSSSSLSTSSDESHETKKSDFPKKPAMTQDQSRSTSSRALIFTRSTASASRLVRLLTLLMPILASKIATLTRSTASSALSRKALASFRSGKVSILIATDRASRGLDVPGLENVISYDVPGSALTYVHRVGRTARAGKTGQAWTFVEHREGKWFWSEVGGKSSECQIKRAGKVKRLEIKVDDEELRTRYESALQQLGTEVKE